MNWNQGQQKAINGILEWLNTPNESLDFNDYFAVLSGSAGTGKTTVVKEILSQYRKEVLLAAPTHKAKKVLSLSANRPATTIHQILGLRPNVDLSNFDPNDPAFKQVDLTDLGLPRLIVVDECSMINESLLKMLQDRAYEFKTRLLFLGDSYQLNPVKELSISKTFLVKHRFTLTEIVRQADSNPNTTLISLAREAVDNHNAFHNALQVESNFSVTSGKLEGYNITNSKDTFFTEIITKFSDTEAKYDTNFMKVLCYTNQLAAKINRYVKDVVNPSVNLVAPGDILTGYSNISTKSSGILVENGADYIVIEVQEKNFSVNKKIYKGLDVKTDTTRFTILHPDSYPKFAEEVEFLYNRAKRERRWRPYFAFRDNFILMHDFYTEDQSLITKKDIDFGYAITVHKSQGSTYNNVAIAYSNLLTCRDEKERARLVYVAVSRTRHVNLLLI